jgi:hypothetical protein
VVGKGRLGVRERWVVGKGRLLVDTAYPTDLGRRAGRAPKRRAALATWEIALRLNGRRLPQV